MAGSNVLWRGDSWIASAFRRVAAAAAAVVMAGTLTAGSPARVAPEDTSWMQPTQHDPSVPPGIPPQPAPAPTTEASVTGRAYMARPPVWPAPAVVEVDLPSTTASSTANHGVAVAGTPVSVVAVSGGAYRSANATPLRLRVEVFDRAAAAAAGINGVLLRVARADGVATSGRATVSVSYGGFRDAYGADWSSRLRLVELPACALSTSERVECWGTPLHSRNNTSTMTVTAEVGLPAVPSGVGATGGEGTLVALAAGPAGAAGDYAATSLQPSSTWTAGGSSGDFTWSYPMRVPPALGGPAPQVALSYSAQSVDGRMAASNNQPSWVGEGFEYALGFVERRYKPCADDMSGGLNTVKTGDQCWATDNAILSLNGRSTELLRDAAGKWHARTEDGSRIELRTGAANGDNNGEHWVVTTTSGTQYWFGLNRPPGWVAGKPETSSVFEARVYGNHANEPCYVSTFANSHCNQAWRWNLDWVVEPHGNAMSLWYVKETNRYAANNTATDAVAYTRGGYLTRIDYGQRADNAYAAGPTRVAFTTGDRCLSSCGTHEATRWPDTPWDQECTGSPCNVGSPTFWTTRRLVKVTTQLRTDAASAYRDVESWTLTHTFPDPGDTTRAGLWLDRIAHAGHVGAATTVPDVRFIGVQLENRVDGLEGLPSMNWWRIQRITTEGGGEIVVGYSPQDCTASSKPATVHDNRRRCYPVRWTPQGASSPIDDFFHKYVVTSVSQEDPTGVSARAITRYEYLGDPAWHYTDDDGLIKAENKTWAAWRGYAAVRATMGDPGHQTRTETRYFRGMHGDKQPPGTAPRTVTLPAAGGAPAANDEDHYAGMTRESITFNGPGGVEVSGQVSEPWRSPLPTATRTLNGSTVDARFTNVAATWTRTVLDGGRPAQVTHNRSWFDSFGATIKVEDNGDLAVTGDERCTLTDYAHNTTAWLINFPSRVRAHATDCTKASGGGLTETDWAGDVRTSFDQQAFGAAPTRGLVSKVEELKAWNQSTQSPTYLATSTASHDSHGRVTRATDVRGNATTTSYTHNIGGQLTSTKITNHLDWATTTTLEPAWGATLSTVDPNGRKAEQAFDGLGRLTSVWLPGRDRSAGQTASTTYRYDVRTTAPSSVSTAKLTPANGYVTTYELFDALLRPRQTQAPEAGPAGGRIVTDTLHDSAGRVVKTYGPYVADGAPGTALFNTPAENTVPAVTTAVFDGGGRTTESIFSSNGTEKWRTSTRYGGDRTHVTPPAGQTATSSQVDGRGRAVKLWQYQGASATPTVAGSYDETSYTHDNRDRLVRVTDPAGNRWQYTFDLRGRQIQADDPDKGRTTSTYNDAGDLLTTTDARGEVLAYTYDSLGRKTTVRDDTPTGAKRLEWIYDSLTAGGTVRGRQTKSIRWVSGNAYTSEAVGFNTDYTPTGTTYTIPASEVGLAGSYTYQHSYWPNSSLATTLMPDLDGPGGLLDETITHTYTALGSPYELKTDYGGVDADYVTSTTYTRFGETAVTTLLAPNSKGVQVGRYYQDGSRRLDHIWTTRTTAPSTVADQYYSYDPAGNITKLSDTTGADHQCFTYDRLRRLTEAWTPASGDCASAPSIAGLGGPAKYWSTWTFDKVGNRLTQVAFNPATGGRDNTAYTYPAAGAPQPHTLRATTGSAAGSYSYDPAGNTTGRPTTAAGTQTLTWDPEGHQATAADSTGTTSYLYDADGNRLIRRDPTGKTLYLPGQELRHNTASNTKTTTRYYSHNGTVIASRTAAGLSWQTSDHHGTAHTAIATNTAQTVTTRRQTPYGTPRGTQPTWPNDKGFVGGTHDNSGLVHLGAREYDPVVGRFVSVDPIIDHNDPQQVHGYTYASNNPTTMTDPNGLRVCLEECGSVDDRRAREWTQQAPGGCGGALSTTAAEKCTERQSNEDLKRKVEGLVSKHLEAMLYSPETYALMLCDGLGLHDRCGEVRGAQLAWCKEYGTADCLGAIAKSVMAAAEAAKVEDQLIDGGLDPDKAHGRANAFQHAYWMALLVGELGFSTEKALTLGVAHELDHPNPLHHYGHPNSDVDLRNNVGGVVIGGSVTPTWRKVERWEHGPHRPPPGVHGAAAYPDQYVQVPIGPMIRDRVMQAITPGACTYCLDLTGF